jgi:MOSC domain-containing protein YiiM
MSRFSISRATSNRICPFTAELKKAVYAYPAEHYDFWRRELPDTALPWGAFGENFTTEGLLEDEVCIGDRYRVGGVELVVTQPRMPCYKWQSASTDRIS